MEINMHLLCCANCSMPFAIPRDFATRMRETHDEFRCPRGHVNYYPQKTDLEIAQEKVAQKDREINALRQAERQRRDDEMRQARLKLERQQKRARAGKKLKVKK